jgi:two-component system, NtrC family, response regulator HydG
LNENLLESELFGHVKGVYTGADKIISATNRNLDKLLSEGQFREDLFFRINVFPLRIPSLREQREDIPMIVENFIRINNGKIGNKKLNMTPEAMRKLMEYNWPGNVRELRNAIEYAFVLCPGGGIGINYLPVKIVSVCLKRN